MEPAINNQDYIIERMRKMKKFFQVMLVLTILGVIAYKAYQYFTKEPEYEEFDDNVDGAEFDIEAEAEETLANKIKAAAKRVVG